MIVGQEEWKFMVQESVLCENSPVFAASVKKEWRERQDRLITLPEDRPDDFDLYAQWVYRGQIFSRKPLTEPGKESGFIT